MLNFKTKYLSLRNRLLLYIWKSHLTKPELIKKFLTFYHTKILSMVCEATKHSWETKIEWYGDNQGKHRVCERCWKREKYKSMFSTELE